MRFNTRSEIRKYFSHGDQVIVSIDDTVINDAKINLNERDIYYCQNKKAGSRCRDMLGYRCSWVQASSVNWVEKLHLYREF